MKRLLIGTIVIAGLFFFYYKYWTSDGNERRLRKEILNCLDEKQKTLEHSATYHAAFRAANVFYQTQKDTLEPFAEIRVPVERVFDKYIFFNRDSSKCLLLLLEKYPDDFRSGYLRIIQGDLNEKWKFSVGMHMSFPEEDIEPLFPEEFDAGIKNYTFEMLSKRGRVAVINHGDSKIRNCDIDEDWWFNQQ